MVSDQREATAPQGVPAHLDVLPSPRRRFLGGRMPEFESIARDAATLGIVGQGLAERLQDVLLAGADLDAAVVGILVDVAAHELQGRGSRRAALPP